MKNLLQNINRRFNNISKILILKTNRLINCNNKFKLIYNHIINNQIFNKLKFKNIIK